MYTLDNHLSSVLIKKCSLYLSKVLLLLFSSFINSLQWAIYFNEYENMQELQLIQMQFSCIFKYNDNSIFNEMLLLSSMFCTIVPLIFQDHGKIPQCSCYARCWSHVLVECVSVFSSRCFDVFLLCSRFGHEI